MTKNNTNKPQIHQGADHTSPYPVSRLAPGFDLVDLAREIQQADQLINTTTHARLKTIADQILGLKQQAREILEETQRNQQLHRAHCQFKKIPGKTYHLYKKDNGQLYFSMLSPEDWGDGHSHRFQGSYTLQADMSWKNITDPSSNESDDSLSHLLDKLK